MRLLYGLDRLPGTLAHDDPRLPAVELDERMLRLNSVAVPQPFWPANAMDHDACWSALRVWLQSRCGDYDRLARNFMVRYLVSVEAHVARHADELERLLAPFDGLYRPMDWCWSAPRPLPRAWLGSGRADIAFWDGARVVPLSLGTLGDGDTIEEKLPDFQRFWTGQILPLSPFRRVLV